MKAVIETGGKQYFVREGSIIFIEKIDIKAGKEVIFDKILMVNGVSGHPYVPRVHVIGKVLKHGKQKKITIFKYLPKKSSHKKQGHRQPYTKVEIKKIKDIKVKNDNRNPEK